MTPSTEVLLCTYNGRAYVREQLQSILEQTTMVDRVSIWDDGSSDDTVKVVRTFIDELPEALRGRFALRSNARNLGYAANFMCAIAEAREEILILCDQDDVWEPEKVSSLLAEFDRRGVDMVASDAILIDANGQRLRSQSVLQAYGLSAQDVAEFPAGAFSRLARSNFVNGASMAVRRQAAQAALPLPGDMPHDYWLSIWCSVHGGLVVIPRPLYRYRQHDRNTIGIGTTGTIRILLGVWRHPRKPRERELRNWSAVTERLSAIAAVPATEIAQEKLAWLRSVVDCGSAPSGRLWRILGSAWKGSYGRFASGEALARDLLSLVRR